MIFLWIVLTLLAVVVGVFVFLLFSPVVAELDTGIGRITVRWSRLLSYVRPMPGTEGPRKIALVGIPFELREGRRKHPRDKDEKKEKKRLRPEHVEARRRRRQRQARLLWACLLDDDVRGALMRRFRRLPADLWDAVEVSQWRSNVSLPDPALNGMLWGALAAGYGGPRAHIQCNFEGRNTVQTEVRLYPHRVAKAFAIFFLRMPYRAIYRHWRAS